VDVQKIVKLTGKILTGVGRHEKEEIGDRGKRYR
jgi:hypothetical protein